MTAPTERLLGAGEVEANLNRRRQKFIELSAKARDKGLGNIAATYTHQADAIQAAIGDLAALPDRRPEYVARTALLGMLEKKVKERREAYRKLQVQGGGAAESEAFVARIEADALEDFANRLRAGEG